MDMSEPLRLPEGYNIELQLGGPDLLLLKRGDGSTVAAVEIFAFGSEPDQMSVPEPDQIRQMAWDDAG